MFMMKTLSVLAAAAALALAGCGKAQPPSGTGACKIRDQVYATYGWSKGRMAYIIYCLPGASVDTDTLAGNAKITKENDFFEGGLDGKKQMTKSPFKVDPKKGEISVEGKTYRGANVLLVNPAAKEKVQMVTGVAFGPAPKDPDEWAIHAEAEARRIAKENPKIAEFPNEPAPAKPDPKKKK
jgi:hypothetical protein